MIVTKLPEPIRSLAEIFARQIGEQISGKIVCPGSCHDQPMYVVGDFEDILYCPHCEMEVQLTVKIY